MEEVAHPERFMRIPWNHVSRTKRVREEVELEGTKAVIEIRDENPMQHLLLNATYALSKGLVSVPARYKTL